MFCVPFVIIRESVHDGHLHFYSIWHFSHWLTWFVCYVSTTSAKITQLSISFKITAFPPLQLHISFEVGGLKQFWYVVNTLIHYTLCLFCGLYVTPHEKGTLAFGTCTNFSSAVYCRTLILVLNQFLTQ